MKHTFATLMLTAVLGGSLLAQEAKPNPPTNAEEKPLQEPYPPRPTGEPPAGWKITILENSKVENKREIAEGKVINIGVPAYKLEPDTKGGEPILVIQDPHYNPLLKNAQTETLGATITEFSEEAQALAQKLKVAIDTLEKSLKVPEEKEKTQPAPTPKKEEPKKETPKKKS